MFRILNFKTRNISINLNLKGEKLLMVTLRLIESDELSVLIIKINNIPCKALSHPLAGRQILV